MCFCILSWRILSNSYPGTSRREIGLYSLTETALGFFIHSGSLPFVHVWKDRKYSRTSATLYTMVSVCFMFAGPLSDIALKCLYRRFLANDLRVVLTSSSVKSSSIVSSSPDSSGVFSSMVEFCHSVLICAAKYWSKSASSSSDIWNSFPILLQRIPLFGVSSPVF